VHGLRHSGKRVSFSSVWAAALGEEGFFSECLGCGARGRGFLPRVSGLLRSEKRVFSQSVALGKDFFLKKENGIGRPPMASILPRVTTRLSGKVVHDFWLLGKAPP